jgi:hypothetical protein
MRVVETAVMNRITWEDGFNPDDRSSSKSPYAHLGLISSPHRAKSASIWKIRKDRFKSVNLIAGRNASENLMLLMGERTHDYFEFHELLSTGVKVRAPSLTCAAASASRSAGTPSCQTWSRSWAAFNRRFSRGRRGPNLLVNARSTATSLKMGEQQLFSPHCSVSRLLATSPAG